MNRFSSRVEGYESDKERSEQSPKKISAVYTEQSNEQPLVDFEALLQKRDEVRERLKTVQQINPEATNESDDVRSIMRSLEHWFEEDVTGHLDFRRSFRGREREDKYRDAAEAERKRVYAHVQERFNEILDRIKERIQIECNSIGNLHAIHETATLIASAEEHEKRVRVREDLTFSSDNSVASYSPSEGKIYVNKKNLRLETSPSELVQALAEEGFSESAKTLHHEHIHSEQYPPKSEREKLARKIKERTVWLTLLGLSAYQFGVIEAAGGLAVLNKLMPFIAIPIVNVLKRTDSRKTRTIAVETQAYWGSERFAGESDQHTKRGIEHRRMFSSFADFMEHISKYEVIRTKGDTDKLIIAFDEIRRLYALGMTDKEIGPLVKKAKWNKEKSQYDLLDEKIKELMAQKNLDEEDVDALVDAENIRARIYAENVKAIAREQLRETYIEQKRLARDRHRRDIPQ